MARPYTFRTICDASGNRYIYWTCGEGVLKKRKAARRNRITPQGTGGGADRASGIIFEGDRDDATLR